MAALAKNNSLGNAIVVYLLFAICRIVNQRTRNNTEESNMHNSILAVAAILTRHIMR
jgi:hypothetical protein